MARRKGTPSNKGGEVKAPADVVVKKEEVTAVQSKEIQGKEKAKDIQVEEAPKEQALPDGVLETFQKQKGKRPRVYICTEPGREGEFFFDLLRANKHFPGAYKVEVNPYL